MHMQLHSLPVGVALAEAMALLPLRDQTTSNSRRLFFWMRRGTNVYYCWSWDSLPPRCDFFK